MIVITGGAGFIGSRIAEHLNRKLLRNDLLLVDSLGKSSKWKHLNDLEFLDYLDKKEFLFKIESGFFDATPIECLFHMGACSSTVEENMDYLIENNYRYSRKLLEYCLRNDVRFIYASSAATYGSGAAGFDDELPCQRLRPLNPYGFSKQIFDLWVLRKGLDNQCAGLKFFNVYGAGEDHKGDMSSVVFKAFRQINESGSVKLFKSLRKDYEDGGQLRDFVYVKDVVEQATFFMLNPKINGIFNAGSGKARTFYDLVSAVFDAMRRPVSVEFVPMPEHLAEKYQYFTEAKMDKIRKVGFNHVFHTLEEGVADYVRNDLLPQNGA